MKNLIAILSLAFLVACGGGDQKSVETLVSEGNMDALKELRAGLMTAQKETGAKLKEIEDALGKEDELLAKKLPLISVFNIEGKEFNHYVELQGSVETNQNVVVYPELSGSLLDFKVSMGDRVSKGQTVALIDDGGMRKQLAQAEQGAKLSKTTFERRKRLWDQKIGSEIDYLTAETKYLSDIDKVQQMQEQVAKAVVTAPFSGIIDETLADEGQIVLPGQTPLFRIVNLSDMYIKADVPEKYLATVQKGKMVKVNLPVLDTMISTRIEKVSNYINPANRTFRIEVNVPNEGGLIKPNLTAKLLINDYTSDEAVLIPQSIISENSEGKQYVYKVKTTSKRSMVEKVFIETGVKQGDYIEVLKGLVPNDVVVQEGARTVKDQQEVQIIK
ncbi:MAG: efflux RND transporter periplasmic adaptor subunit [Flavobacteriales bacterium]|nr:efflux RND transporter periplasmic adaptor subunit [Flavobacteriales bacterium]